MFLSSSPSQRRALKRFCGIVGRSNKKSRIRENQMKECFLFFFFFSSLLFFLFSRFHFHSPTAKRGLYRLSSFPDHRPRPDPVVLGFGKQF